MSTARRLGVIAGHFDTAPAQQSGAPPSATAGACAALLQLLDGDTPARAELRQRMKEHMRTDPELFTP